MVRGWTLSMLIGATLAWGAGPGEAAVPLGAVERGPATRLERPSEVTSAAVDELLERSGLRAQLEALAGGIRAQLVTTRARRDSRDRVMIDRIAARHFDAELLYARIRLQFGRGVDGAKLDAALAWYRSPLGGRITRHEVEAITAERALVPLPTEERIELVQRLDERGGASETALDIAMSLVRSLTRAAEPFRPAHLRLTAGQLEDRMARTRTEVLAPIRITCLQNMLFAYRELDDQELAEYARFVESPAGQWYVATMNQALVDATAVAAELAAVELLPLVPHLTGDTR
jgi:hypothetical protein